MPSARHLPPLVVDGHEDIAFNVLCGQRDYRRAVAETRALEVEAADVREHLGIATLGLPEWLDGQVAVIFATIFTEPARSPFGGGFCRQYATSDEAHAIGRQQVEVYERLTDDQAPFRLIRTTADLDAVLASWEPTGVPDRPQGEGDPRRIGLVLLMENADPIRSPAEVDEWYAAGVRLIGPAWMASRYCGGTAEPGPLTEDGRHLLDGMARLGMTLDTSHMAELAFFEAVDRYAGPVIASHSNPRHFVDGDRHLSDEMIRALAERDGVIGQVPFNAFLVPGWSRSDGSPKEAATIDTVVRAIDHICELTGSARHVAVGSDLDGGFGAEATPLGIETVADLQRIADALDRRGYLSADVDAIAHGNWLRVLRRTLPVGLLT